MSRIVYNSTDDNPVEGDIKINGSLQSIPTDSTIIAFVSDIDDTVKVIDDITINSTDDGNDWPNGRIKGYFPKSGSAALAAYDEQKVKINVRATIGGYTETFTKIIEAQKLL